MSEEFKKAICNSIQENKDKIEKLNKQNVRLKKQNKQLKEKINKAIEYIHWRYDNRQDMYITQIKELLETLGDKE